MEPDPAESLEQRLRQMILSNVRHPDQNDGRHTNQSQFHGQNSQHHVQAPTQRASLSHNQRDRSSDQLSSNAGTTLGIPRRDNRHVQQQYTMSQHGRSHHHENATPSQLYSSRPSSQQSSVATAQRMSIGHTDVRSSPAPTNHASPRVLQRPQQSRSYGSSHPLSAASGAIVNPSTPTQNSHRAMPTYQEQIHLQCAYLDRVGAEQVRQAEMSVEELTAKEAFRDKLESICQSAYATFYTTEHTAIQLKAFGSVQSGYATKGSDMDLAVVSTAPDAYAVREVSPFAKELPRLLEKAILKADFGARLLVNTRVPIIKICEKPTETLKKALLEERERWDALSEEEKWTAPKSKDTEDTKTETGLAGQSSETINQSEKADLNPEPDLTARIDEVRSSKLHENSEALEHKSVLKDESNDSTQDDESETDQDGKDSNLKTFGDNVEIITVMPLKLQHLTEETTEGQIRDLFLPFKLIRCKINKPGKGKSNASASIKIAWEDGELALAAIADKRLNGRRVNASAVVSTPRRRKGVKPSVEPESPAKEIWIAKLTPEISNEQIKSFLRNYNVQTIKRHKKKIHATVELATIDDAKKAIADLDKSLLGGQEMHLAFYNPPKPSKLQLAVVRNSDGSFEDAASLLKSNAVKETEVKTSSNPSATVSDSIATSPTTSSTPSQQILLKEPKHDDEKALQSPRKDKKWVREQELGPLDFPKAGVGIQCDINFSNPLGIHNTHLLRCYSACDSRIRPFVLFIKSWSKRRLINSPRNGTLSSYGYVLMVLHYVVNIARPPLAPNLQSMWAPDMDGETDFMGYNVRFWRDEEAIKRAAAEGQFKRNNDHLAALVRGFFQYYSTFSGFNWTREVLSLRTHGGVLPKMEKGWTGATTTLLPDGREVRQRYLFAIEDPFEHEHNVARTITHYGIVALRDELRRAWRILQQVGAGRQPEEDLFDEASNNVPLSVGASRHPAQTLLQQQSQTPKQNRNTDLGGHLDATAHDTGSGAQTKQAVPPSNRVGISVEPATTTTPVRKQTFATKDHSLNIGNTANRSAMADAVASDAPSTPTRAKHRAPRKKANKEKSSGKNSVTQPATT